MLIVFFRAIILYFIIVISIRLMGKRQIGELQPSELVVTILMSNIATLPIEDINIPMIMGVVPIFTLVCDLDEVQLAVVETTGKISVYQKQSCQPCTPKDLGIDVKCKNPPQLIVTDGEIADNALDFIGSDRKWLMNVLKKEKCTLDQVFLMTCDGDGKYKLIRKTGGKNK